MNKYRRLIIFLTAAALLFSCIRQSEVIDTYKQPAWKYSDLLAFDPSDSFQAEDDLIAVYFRNIGGECQIRLDMLDSAGTLPDIFVGFDSQPGGETSLPIPLKKPIDVIAWEYLIGIMANDQIISLQSDDMNQKISGLRITRDTKLDFIEFSFNCPPAVNNISHTKIQVFISHSESVSANRDGTFNNELVDTSLVLNLDGSPPAPANVLFYFYNTFAGKTPAQTLKSWDGAHTGTESSRHGLVHLVKAVDDYKIPVIMGDLATPANLSALEYSNHLEIIRQLANDGLLILAENSLLTQPDPESITIPKEIYLQSLHWTEKVRKDFGIPGSRILTTPYWPGNLPIPGTAAILIPEKIETSTLVSICKWGNVKVICSKQSPPRLLSKDWSDPITTAYGLTVEIKKSLVDSAMRNQGDLFLLGGDFERSALGNAGTADQVFEYIRSHPWINVVDETGLSGWKPRTANQLLLPKNPIGGNNGSNQQKLIEVVEKLRNLPPNPITDFAWQVIYMNLSTENEKILQMNLVGIGQIGHLIAASNWLQSPYRKAGCDSDFTWDGKLDCILADRTIFASFDSVGGGLVSMFSFENNRVNMIVTPSYFVATGLSDISRINPEAGVYGDPDAPGAGLVEPAFSRAEYKFRVTDNSIEFLSQDGKVMKTFQIIPEGVQVVYKMTSPQTIRLQTAINPWDRYSPGWNNYYRGKIEILPFEFRTDDFSEPLPYLDQPEDPNFDYGRGYFVLFPFQIYQIWGANDGIILVRGK